MNGEQVSWDEARAAAALLHALIRRMTAGNHDDPVTSLPLAQLRLCHALRGKARSMSAISRELGTSLSAVTQIADRLERSGLVKRAARGDDRRVRCLRLTGRGEELMRLHEENRVRRMTEVLEKMSPADRQSIMAALETLAEAAGRDGDATELHVHFDASKVLI